MSPRGRTRQKGRRRPTTAAWKLLRGIERGLLMPCLLMVPMICSAQSLTGTTGLLSIPVAHLPSDGTVSVSAGFVNKKYSDYVGGTLHYVPYGGSVVFLPFLELGFRFSRAISEQPQALGDRSVSARVQLLKEGPRRPALLVGAHDFMHSTQSQTSKRFAALYVVASKSLKVHPALPPLALHAGYGTDWIPAHSRQFVGLFGGISIFPAKYLELMLEYDGEIVSVGQRVRLFDHVHLLIGLQNFDVVAATAGFYFSLET